VTVGTPQKKGDFGKLIFRFVDSVIAELAAVG